MITLTEGALTFSFPASWAVCKYDDTAFYQRSVIRTGAGLAAVDFALSAGGLPRRLVLIEAKDFRDHAVANRYRLHSGELATEVARKALHTLGALAAGTLSQPAELRLLLSAIAPAAEVVQVVLVLEEDALPSISAAGHLSTANKIVLDSRLKLRGKLADDLKRKLRPLGFQTTLYDSGSVPVRAGWTVQ